MQDFFTESELKSFNQYSGSKYQKNDFDSIHIRESIIKPLWNKTGYWIEEVKKTGESLLSSHFEERWIVPSKKSKFKEYTWGKLYAKGLENKEIFFTVGITIEGNLLIKIDYQHESKKLSKEQIKLINQLTFNEENDWKYYTLIPLSQIKQYNWDILVNETVQFIDWYFDIYKDIIIKVYKDENIETSNKYEFNSGNFDKGTSSSLSYISKSKIIYINRKHNDLSLRIYELLKTKYGDVVAREKHIQNNNQADLITHIDNKKVFYEIKPYHNTRICIRESIGQLLEYALHSTNDAFHKLIIVSTAMLHENDKEYLQKLRELYSLPIYYQRFDEALGLLDELE